MHSRACFFKNLPLWAFLLLPGFTWGQATCVDAQLDEFVEWQEGEASCQGIPSLSSSSIAAAGTVTSLTFQFGTSPNSWTGMRALLRNPDNTAEHLIWDQSGSCPVTVNSMTIVNWDNVLGTNGTGTVILDAPLQGEGIWTLVLWEDSFGMNGSVVLKVDLNGSCETPGCTNPTACNFSEEAVLDDGSCVLPASADGCCETSVVLSQVLEATQTSSLTFEASGQPFGLSVDLFWENLGGDGSWPADVLVELENGNGTCISWGGFNVSNDCSTAGEWPDDWTFTTSTGNYSASFPLNLDSIPAASGLWYNGLWTLSISNGWANSSGVSIDLQLTLEGLCPASGCGDPDACNYNPQVLDNDDSCLYADSCGVCGGSGNSCQGCTNPDACNFEPNAINDDNSCLFEDCLGVCGGDAQVDGCGVCDGDGVSVSQEINPLYSLQAGGSLPQATPFISFFSGWFEDQILLRVENPTAMNFGNVQVVASIESSDMVLESPVVALPALGEFWFTSDMEGNYFLLPENVGAVDANNGGNLFPLEWSSSANGGSSEELGGVTPWSSVALLLNNQSVDALGGHDGSAGVSLSDLTISGVPKAARQHALVRKPYVLWGDPTGTAEANLSNSCRSTWTVLDENEGIPPFQSAWSLSPTIAVGIDCATGDCLNDLNGDGICDEIELPEVPWCNDVNSPDYGPQSLQLQCEPAAVIEYLVSSCCSTLIDSEMPPVAGLLSATEIGSSALSAQCGQGASKLAFCYEGQRAFVTDPENREVRLYNYANLQEPGPIGDGSGGFLGPITSPNGSPDYLPTDVDIWTPGHANFAGPDSSICCSTMVAISWVNANAPLDSSIIAFYNSDGMILDAIHGVVATAAGTQALSFSDDGRWLVAANSGAGLAAGAADDPVASVTTIDVSSYSQTPGASDLSGIVSTLAHFNTLTSIDGLPARTSTDIWPQPYSLGQILEPSAIQVDPDSHTVWINCQINNTLVQLDLDSVGTSNAVVGAWGWGVRDMEETGGINATANGNPGLDAGINLFGWRQPDGMSVFSLDNITYALTANEGMPRALPDGSLSLAQLGAGPYAGLEVDPYYGGGAAAGPADSVFVFGARSFSLWKLNHGMEPNLLFDSGSELEERLALVMPDHANSLESTIQSGDLASLSRGPEPKGVSVGKVKSQPYAFVSLESMGGVMMYRLHVGDTVTVPGASFEAYATNRFFNANPAANPCSVGDLGAEDVLFLPNNWTESPFDAVLVANDFNGTLTTYGVEPSLQGCTDSCACNYDDFATVDDGSCDFTSCSGCTYPEADNYSTNALIDDGSCLFTNPCPADLNDDGSINTGDLLDFLAQYGSICP